MEAIAVAAPVLPADVAPALVRALEAAGLGTATTVEPVVPGMVSRVDRIRTSAGSAILKRFAPPPADLYAVEAEALGLLAGTPGWQVPRVLLVTPTALLLEDLGPQPRWDQPPAPPESAYWEQLGRGLAHLHGRLGGRFGWHQPTRWGLVDLPNEPDPDGHRFYAEQRFRAGARRPRVRAALSRIALTGLERLADQVPHLFPRQRPCLVHGDLWSGNRGITAGGTPTVFDPYLHYGWPEWDFHATLLFGGFAPRFYDAYRECHPLDPGWRERAVLLGILHLVAMVDITQQRWVIDWAERLLRPHAALH